MSAFKDLIASDVADVFLNTDDFADSCLYAGALFTGTLSLIPSWPSTNRRRADDICGHGGVSAIGVDFEGAAGAFTAEDPALAPSAGDTITWTDERNQPREFIVFPRVAGRSFEYGTDRLMLTIHTVESSQLHKVRAIGGNKDYFAIVAANRQETVTSSVGTQERTIARDTHRLYIACPPSTFNNRSKLTIARNVTGAQPVEGFHVNRIESVFDDLTVLEVWRDGVTKQQARGTEGAN